MSQPSASARFRIGIDTGGTFTAIVSVDTLSGATQVTKVASTPANRGIALVRGVKAHAEPGGYSRWGMASLKLAKEASRELKLPVYVHLGTLWP